MAASDHDAAYRALRRMFGADGRPVHYFLAPRVLPQLAWCAARTGRQVEVARLLEHGAGPVATPRLAALVAHARALLAPGDEAEEHFRAALSEPANGQHWPLEFAETQLGYAGWLRRRRRPSEASALLVEAVATFERLGARGHVEQARRHLRGGAGGVSTFDRLTAQQQQIVRLAAAGLTNQQIGKRLSISGRTVGSHLYRIYPVLEVANRAQLRDVLPTS
jgi:hypothetical protein